MDLFYFGNADQSLFGIYHAPLTNADRDMGIVLCNPFGSEYVFSHRTLRILAVRLAGIGFHVLRFDYFGSGDSAGESDAATVEQWKKNISMAIDQIKDVAGVSRVSLIGLRLGATLAAIVAPDRGDVENLLLWEPVIQGQAYIKEMESIQQSWLALEDFPTSVIQRDQDEPVEILGFPLTSAMRESIRKIDLLNLQRRPARKVLLLRNLASIDDAPIAKHLGSLGAAVDKLKLVSPSVWLESSGFSRVVVPNQILQSILEWISRD